MNYLLCILLVTSYQIVSALYGPGTDVIELTSANFDSQVSNSDAVWIVEFYAPWCGHCKSLAPEYKKAATALKGVVKVAGIDCDVHKDLAGRFGVRGFPTIKIFGANKNQPDAYNGARTAAGLVNGGLDALKTVVNQRLGGGGQQRSSGGGSGKNAVIELTDSNFEKTVIESDDIWLVEFFAPWCGHCKRLEPEWASAASQLEGKVKVGALDADSMKVMAQRFGVQGFPTIKFFRAGKKSFDSAEDYNGGRSADDIVKFGLELATENLPPPEVVEITSEEVLTKACSKQLCVISFLPDILDCQSECRNKHLSMLKDVGESFKKNNWGWLWAEGGSQNKLEESLGVGGFGYPAMAAVNSRKMKFALLKGSFSNSGIKEFLRALAFGRGSTEPVRGAKLPKITKSDPWDGKDGEMPTEDDDMKDEL